MRVLIADDQKSVGASLADLVGACDHEVVEVVGSGLEAILAYSRHQPDVVLMDYWMPKLNGATACRNILAKDPMARVILVSGWSPSHEFEEIGAITILAKPVRLERLRAALDAVMLPPIFPEQLDALSALSVGPGLETMPTNAIGSGDATPVLRPFSQEAA